jgi:glutathione S-transferase
MHEPLPILYSFRRCPYAIRARLAIAQAGLEVDLREVSLRDKPPAMLALSPKGTVPVLLCPNGQVLDESWDIMVWALGIRDRDNWLRHTDRALVAINDGAFKVWLDRYKYASRHPEHSARHYRDQALQCLIAPLEEKLARHPFLGGASADLTDAAIFPFVRQFAAVDPTWFAQSPWAATRAWIQAWVSSALFAQVMRK